MVALVLVSLTTAACGGGGGGGAVPSTPGGSPTATPVPAPAATSLPASAGGISATLNVTANGTLTAQAATANPTGTGVLALRRPATLASGSPLLYITLSGSNTTITAIGGTFTLASAPAQPVFLAYWTGTEWDSVSLTPATISNGTTATFAAVALSPAVPANPNAYFALYTGSGTLPTASPSPAPSPTATSTSTGGTFVDTACTQSAATATNALTNVASTFFSTIVPTAHTICISAWDLSSNIDTALEAAARNGASVTVITPYSQNGSNSSNIAAIVAAGGHAKYEYTSSHGTATASIAYQLSPMDIHAKFALVDGIAYMDGHNWFTTDVVMEDGYAADFAAIQADLVTFATPAPGGSGGTATFTTDKQLSLKNESAYLQAELNTGGVLSTGTEYDFITESFNPTGDGEYNDDVYDGMCQIAALPAHVTMHIMAESYSGYSPAAQSALQNLMALDPNASVHTDNSGHEKISMVRPTAGATPSSAWFGSSNATTTDLFDWGMDITDTGMLTALATYFDGEFNPASVVTPSPGQTPVSCVTPHP